MSMNVQTRAGRTAEINVTPLIDVLLVLLIIFMVILPPHSLGELSQIPQPNTEPRTQQIEDQIVIQLKDQGPGQRPEVAINQKQVKWEELEGLLQSIYRARQDRVAFVKGDPEIEFSFVAEALDISHRAGADRVGLLGKEKVAQE